MLLLVDLPQQLRERRLRLAHGLARLADVAQSPSEWILPGEDDGTHAAGPQLFEVAASALPSSCHGGTLGSLIPRSIPRLEMWEE
jgi:hypothetical protein